ncbi:MAG TPA: SDR family oxidoreductase [Caulobacteraceae bacterium]|nr:SDR family oxidoreductase [Caulobacteraceae bacterium]
MNPKPLSGKHALVTGGGTGIGAAAACFLSNYGCQVTVLGRRLEKLQEGLFDVEEGFAVVADVTRDEELEAAFSKARERFGRIDILVNNAGVAKGGPFLKTPQSDWDEIFAVNVFAAAACTRLALPPMLEEGWGRVVNVASIAGLRGSPYTTAYTASKHALVGMTRSLALETVKKGVTVNAICPGYVDTPMTDRTVEAIQAKTGRSPEEARAEVEKLGQQGRLLQADEVGSAIAFLCLPEQAGINGASIPLGGEG